MTPDTTPVVTDTSWKSEDHGWTFGSISSVTGLYLSGIRYHHMSSKLTLCWPSRSGSMIATSGALKALLLSPTSTSTSTSTSTRSAILIPNPNSIPNPSRSEPNSFPSIPCLVSGRRSEPIIIHCYSPCTNLSAQRCDFLTLHIA